MAEVTVFLADLRRYRQLIAEQLPSLPLFTFVPTLEGPSSLQIERAEILAAAVCDPSHCPGASAEYVNRLIEIAPQRNLAQVAIIDTAGHHRPVYRPLLAYAFIHSFKLLYESLPRADFGRWEEATRAWADTLEEELHQVPWPAMGMPAARGAGACESAFAALALHIAGKVFIRDAFTDQAADIFGKLVRGQQASGNFLTITSGDNPETAWYHELVLLHAAATYAVHAEDRIVAAAVARAADFHQNETQPDHATNQPWGLFTFIWNSSTRPLADQLIHSMRIQNPAGLRGISAVLAADAILCIDQFL